MGSSPNYAATLQTSAVAIATAEASRVTPTNFATLLTGGANGSVVAGVHVKAAGNTTAGAIFIWMYDGATYYLLHEISVAAITASSTLPSFEGRWIPTGPDGRDRPINIKSGWSLRVSTLNAEAFRVHTILAGDI